MTAEAQKAAEETKEQSAASPEPEAPQPVDVGKIKSILAANEGARMRMWLSICSRCGLCAESCFFYLAKDKDPKLSPAYKAINTIGKMYRAKGEVSREFLEGCLDVVWGQCTACRRCTMYCPFGIDIATMIVTARAVCYSQGIVPDGLARTTENIRTSGNQMAMATEDWIETCDWMAEEYGEEVHGLEIPMDKQGADYMYTVNPREPMYYPQDVGMAAQVFHVAGLNWTMPSTGWDSTNLAMFAGNKAVATIPVKAMYDKALELEAKAIVITECGHAFRSAKFEGPYWLGIPGGKPPVPVIHSVELFRDIMRDGKIKLKHKFKHKVTFQDPCNVSRNGGLWDIGRELVNLLCEDFVDMTPNREHNHCCGGGGGFIPMGPPFKKRRMESGKVKAEQIRATGATHIIVPCHNCFDQINDLNKEYELGVKVVSFKEIITELMEIPESMIPPEEDEEEAFEAEEEAKKDAEEEAMEEAGEVQGS
ncbi:MAG: (Fe-S)-binding protein [Proteobacteria bacterium]|nr:(Fe-S)-binding protein [Pseudomonadota bacterium]MBU1452893.1 (Fe-S)-binding protein [Pseudomonadota bacterium]MBU2469304.1 (Fe-S)-binding protein [Pseudomonadota bacterium]MBU2517590.1 (Fe-S)-binding protein [Pseudomonadota bacterium]